MCCAERTQRRPAASTGSLAFRARSSRSRPCWATQLWSLRLALCDRRCPRARRVRALLAPPTVEVRRRRQFAGGEEPKETCVCAHACQCMLVSLCLLGCVCVFRCLGGGRAHLHLAARLRHRRDRSPRLVQGEDIAAPGGAHVIACSVTCAGDPQRCRSRLAVGQRRNQPEQWHATTCSGRQNLAVQAHLLIDSQRLHPHPSQCSVTSR